MTSISKAKTIWEALKDAAQASPDRTGYVFLSEEISFHEMDKRSDRVACGLLQLGMQKGDRIGIIGLNQPEWIYLYFAAAKIGAVVVGLSVRFRSLEFEYILNHSETSVVATLPAIPDMNYVDFFQQFSPKIPSVKKFIFIGGDGFDGSTTMESLLNTEVDRDALNDAQQSVTPEDLMMIIYTSGTTGKPKGAAISHQSQLASAQAQAEHTRISEDDVVPLALPFNHVGGITCGILTTLLGRGKCILIPMFDPKQVIQLGAKYGATIVPGVPTMHTLVLMNENLSSWDTSNVRLVITGGSNAEPDLLEKLYKTFPGAAVMNLYGLSESSGAVVMSPWDSDFHTTVRSIGKPIGDFQVKAVDEDGNELPAGEIGELCFQGDAVVSSYFRGVDESADAFHGSWLKTGDMGYIDDQGYITLMGRKKEMYLQGGFNVYPVEVENLLTKHPKVVMAAGIGVPDSVLGEVGRYYIVPKPGTEPTKEEIIEYCKEYLADYKVPRQIEFRTELPLTPVGKIKKSLLKEEYEKGS